MLDWKTFRIRRNIQKTASFIKQFFKWQWVGATASENKLDFLRNETEWLVHFTNRKGKKQATKNKSSLRKIPKLKNTKQQKSFLGAKHHLSKYRKTSFNQTDGMRNLVCKANQMGMGRRKKIPIPEKKLKIS